jgi:nicotinamidase-related amidase
MNPGEASMSVPDRLEKHRVCLVVIDLQERFRTLIVGMDDVQRGCSRLARFFAKLDLPILVTEHYPRKLGETMGELREVVPAFRPLEKITFSCADDLAFTAELAATGRDQVVLCGIETHVCVYQTARDLRAGGVQVVVAADAVSSQSARDRDLALAHMRAIGVQVLSAEMVLFEILREARTPDFKLVADILRGS